MDADLLELQEAEERERRAREAFLDFLDTVQDPEVVRQARVYLDAVVDLLEAAEKSIGITEDEMQRAQTERT